MHCTLSIGEKIIEKVAIHQTRTDKHSCIAHDDTSNEKYFLFFVLSLSVLIRRISLIYIRMQIYAVDHPAALRVLALIFAALAQDAQFLMVLATAEDGLPLRHIFL